MCRPPAFRCPSSATAARHWPCSWAKWALSSAFPGRYPPRETGSDCYWCGNPLPKPPLCKGRCQRKALTEGLSITETIPQSASLTAPFTQGGRVHWVPSIDPRRAGPVWPAARYLTHHQRRGTLAPPYGDLSIGSCRGGVLPRPSVTESVCAYRVGGVEPLPYAPFTVPVCRGGRLCPPKGVSRPGASHFWPLSQK